MFGKREIILVRQWWRNFRVLYHKKVLRQSGDPAYIARGVALGLIVGWVIPMGFQIILVLPLAFVLKAAKVPAVVFTFVSNHFTVIFLYPLQCWLGGLVLRNGLTFGELTRTTGKIVAALEEASMHEAWQEFSKLGGQVISSFFVGGLLLGIPSALVGYYLTLQLVRRYRKFREARRERSGSPAPEKDGDGRKEQS